MKSYYEKLNGIKKEIFCEIFLGNEGKYFTFDGKIFFGDFRKSIYELKPIDDTTLDILVNIINEYYQK